MALPKKRKQNITISLLNYITNPTGKGSGNVVARYRIRQSLNLSFIQLLSKNRRNFRAIPYVYDDGDILFHVKVPSETHGSEIMYDVLIYLTSDNKMYKNRPVKFWSNSPAFMFTYGYVYYHTDLMIDDFADKFPNIVLSDQPVVRNPLESLGYEKSTYIAGRYLIEGQCLTDSYIKRYGIKVTPSNIRHLKDGLTNPTTIVNRHNLLTKAKRRKNIKSPETKSTLKKKMIADKMRQDAKRKKIASNAKKVGIKRGSRSKITARKAKKSLSTKRR